MTTPAGGPTRSAISTKSILVELPLQFCTPTPVSQPARSNIAAELGVIPEKVTVGFGIRRGKSGDTSITGSNASDNAILLEGSYKLAQNMLLNLVYTSQSGDYWNAANTAALGSKQTYINLATIF